MSMGYIPKSGSSFEISICDRTDWLKTLCLDLLCSSFSEGDISKRLTGKL